MEFLEILGSDFVKAVKSCFDVDVNIEDFSINETRKEFEGDYTVVFFPLVKVLRKSPVEIGSTLSQWLVENSEIVEGCQSVQGFLNVSFTNKYWKYVLGAIESRQNYGYAGKNGRKVMVEFSSPNTNKPLHLGHIRNILLGWSCSKILKANGYEVINTQIINDRGIAVCKSMLAWLRFGEGETPETVGVKGDHFVGGYYVRFEQEFVKEYQAFQNSAEGKSVFNQLGSGKTEEEFFKGYKNQYFNDYSQLGAQAKDMLLKWESGDEETLALWRKMNNWVYDGFDVTYKDLGVTFDKLYYESDTYLLGKKTVEEGLSQEVFYKEKDGSVWIDLEDAGMDKKIVLRSDGTSVYITQDIGTAQQRYKDFRMDKLIYTVADEQDYHFKVLFEIMKRLKEPYADGLYHLSYGMVDLPSGRMKSREGTVVDADDLISEVIHEAELMSEERGEIAVLREEEQKDILRKIGLAALKFFIIKVQPKKRMTFDPKESVDMQGQTGPYIQNAYVRIQSIKRKAKENVAGDWKDYEEINDYEKTLLRYLVAFPDVIAEAGREYDPSTVANFAYNLAKDFHRFYHEVRILSAETDEARQFRSILSNKVGEVLETAFDLLGIEMPDRM